MFKLNTLVVFLVLALLRHASSQTTEDTSSGTTETDPVPTTEPVTSTFATNPSSTSTTGDGTDSSNETTDTTNTTPFTTATREPLFPTSTTTTSASNTTIASSDDVNLGLILGLSLGLGIPFLAAIIGGLIYYFKRPNPSRVKPMSEESNSTIRAATDIPLAPVPTPRKPIVSTSEQF